MDKNIIIQAATALVCSAIMVWGLLDLDKNWSKGSKQQDSKKINT